MAAEAPRRSRASRTQIEMIAAIISLASRSAAIRVSRAAVASRTRRDQMCLRPSRVWRLDGGPLCAVEATLATAPRTGPDNNCATPRITRQGPPTTVISNRTRTTFADSEPCEPLRRSMTAALIAVPETTCATLTSRLRTADGGRRTAHCGPRDATATSAAVGGHSLSSTKARPRATSNEQQAARRVTSFYELAASRVGRESRTAHYISRAQVRTATQLN